MLLLTLWTVVPPAPLRVERLYSRGIYPWIAAVLVPLGDLVPFPLGWGAVALGVLLLPVVVFRSWRRCRAAGACPGRWLAAGLGRAGVWAVLGYAAFVFLWGANYRRLPIEEQLGLAAPAGEEAAAEDDGGETARRRQVESLVAALVVAIRRNVPPPGERDAGRALEAIRRALYRSLSSWHGVAPVLPGKVKRLPSGSLLRFGTSGMILPLFLEAHTDGALTDVDHLGVAAHELAHVGGLSGEADAELAAIIAGLEADDRYARYAVALQAFRRCAWQLLPEARKRFEAALPRQARSDLEAMRAVAARYATPALRKLQRRSYDVFLRSQGVEAGVRDYSRVVELLVLARRRGLLKT